MLDDRFKNRRRAFLAFRAERMRAFHDAPAVIAALFDLVDHVPKVLADFARPEVARLAVERKTPCLAQSIGVNFRTGVFHGDEWIVLGDAVVLAVSGMIDIQTEEF